MEMDFKEFDKMRKTINSRCSHMGQCKYCILSEHKFDLCVKRLGFWSHEGDVEVVTKAFDLLKNNHNTLCKLTDETKVIVEKWENLYELTLKHDCVNRHNYPGEEFLTPTIEFLYELNEYVEKYKSEVE